MRAPVSIGLVVLAACADNLSPGLASLDVFPDSAIHFAVIGDTLQLTISASDRDGRAVHPAGLELISRNSAVARVDSRGQIESMGNGATYIIVRAADLMDSLRITVAQARDSLVVRAMSSSAILSLPPDALIPLSCRAFDAGGNLLVLASSVSSKTGRISGASCGSLTATASGHDTLTVTAGSYQATIPLVVAIRPVLLSDPAIPLEVDSLPEGLIPWAPSLTRTSGGEFALYFAGYRDAAGHLGGRRGDLHRLVSPDGIHFRYDGIVLQRDAFPCSLQGTGIENVAIVPRSDGAGWRMFYAAGSYACYGWQVFSAVSADEKHWIEEPGVRIPNGSALLPTKHTSPPYPAGEGMDIEQLPGGEWRMLVGSYEHREPREDRFQITEWRSADQLSWTYQGTVLTTRQVGPEANRSIYSPTVHDLAPGLRRMFFGGDNLNVAGGASRVYSAVSIDGAEWQVEGVVLGGGDADYFYCTMVDDLLVFIRTVSGIHVLGSVRIGIQ